MASEKSSMHQPLVFHITSAEYKRIDRSRVFFDLEISHQKKGRVVFELVSPKYPETDVYMILRAIHYLELWSLILPSLLMNE